MIIFFFPQSTSTMPRRKAGVPKNTASQNTRNYLERMRERSPERFQERADKRAEQERARRELQKSAMLNDPNSHALLQEKKQYEKDKKAIQRQRKARGEIWDKSRRMWIIPEPAGGAEEADVLAALPGTAPPPEPPVWPDIEDHPIADLETTPRLPVSKIFLFDSALKFSIFKFINTF